jgi:uncharacterized membrane protein
MDESSIRDLLDVLLRWVHLIAGIMWIGNSLLFNWLDRNLVRDEGAPPVHFGRIWLLHSGAFYDVEKKLLAPDEMPKVLHWFKWQAYTTWMTGLALLVLLYWTGGATLMMDPSVMRLTPGQAVHIGIAFVFGGFLVYDLLWRVLGRVEWLAMGLSLVGLAGAVWGLTHLLSGRAAFIHVGALIGTCMAGNVFAHIIPSQRKLVAATKAGKPQNPEDSKHAKQRSIHNNYLTFPLLFTMLSNHFSSITGSVANWQLLAVFIVGGALSRHWLNIRFSFGSWIPALTATLVGTFAAVAFILARNVPLQIPAAASGPPVAYAQVQFILQTRCVPCHSDQPSIVSNPPAPVGVRFGTPEEVSLWKERIKARVVVTRTMPLNNRTEMTDDERAMLAQWLVQGGGTQLPR